MEEAVFHKTNISWWCAGKLVDTILLVARLRLSRPTYSMFSLNDSLFLHQRVNIDCHTKFSVGGQTENDNTTFPSLKP